MMEFREFAIRQPHFPEEGKTDRWYFDLACRLMDVCTAAEFQLHQDLCKRVALSLTDYLQDIVADGGLWRGFVVRNRQLYGWSVPFHDTPEEYIDFELNREDVRFLVWYVVAMLSLEHRDIYPHHPALLAMADSCYDLLEEAYDDAPLPEEWRLGLGLDMDDPEDRHVILNLGHWLFYNSYLLTPAFALDMQNIVQQTTASLDAKDDPAVAVQQKLDEAFTEYPTGPLALFITEWLYLVVDGKMPPEPSATAEPNHKYYDAFVSATGGKRVRYFDTYDEMNHFFISALGWESGKEHLAGAKGADDYVLMVDPKRGMLMARDVAKCIADPDNPYYDAAYARSHAFNLLTVRGACPADLLRFCIANDYLPDAAFPGSDDTQLVANNADFMARCYLQMFYRD